jgi:hypothetical protein
MVKIKMWVRSKLKEQTIKPWKDIVWLIDKSFLSRITIQNESVI